MRTPNVSCCTALLLLTALLTASPALAQPGTQPIVTDGIAVQLPTGWTSTPTSSTADDIRRIEATERDAASPYPGATLVVEVLPGLNRLQQERWLRGQLLRGLDASYAIEPVATAVVGGTSGAAVSFRKGGRAGYALYTRGSSFYSVRLSAPAVLWQDEARRGALLALMRSVHVGG